MESAAEMIRASGPLIAGVAFGSGWMIWLDAVLCSQDKTAFVFYLPGIGSTLTLFMINAVRREDLQSSDAFDEGGTSRRRAWLFISYLASFGTVGGAIAALAVHFSKHDRDMWTGVAGILQCALILISALLYWITRSSQSGGGLSYY